MSKYSCSKQACPELLIHSPEYSPVSTYDFHLSVNRFPAQEIIGGASKVPSIIYYDKEGRVKAIGAEAINDGILEMAIDGDWYKAEWYIFSCHFIFSIVIAPQQVQASFEIQIH
jgi:hypothetical protein